MGGPDFDLRLRLAGTLPGFVPFPRLLIMLSAFLEVLEAVLFDQDNERIDPQGCPQGKADDIEEGQCRGR